MKKLNDQWRQQKRTNATVSCRKSQTAFQNRLYLKERVDNGNTSFANDDDDFLKAATELEKHVSVEPNRFPLVSQRKSDSSPVKNKCSKKMEDISDGDTRKMTKFESIPLSSLSLPALVLQQYKKCGITNMYKWQADCLKLDQVLNRGNLVYSAPTSAGKTLVAEILMLKCVVEQKKKAIMILPFVSVTREKVYSLQKLFQNSNIRVEGFMGNQVPPGGFDVVDIAICTIEKANGLVNRLIEDNNLKNLGIVVVDELHMIGDPHRGYLLELLLTKLLYLQKRSIEKPDSSPNVPQPIQIIGMSATLPNLKLLADWLDASLFCTDFRPVPLSEKLKIGNTIYCAKTMTVLQKLQPSCVEGDTDHVMQLCIESIASNHGVLIFCPTKAWCERLAESIARSVNELGREHKLSSQNKHGLSHFRDSLRNNLNPEAINDVLDHLRKSSAGLDTILAKTVGLGIAFHHAGLTFDEREIIEGAFRRGAIKVLTATSTLSSGVNLPARRVIIRTPVFNGSLINVLAYRQMVGRAGRTGLDTEGESILVCKEIERNKGESLVSVTLPPVSSCLSMRDQTVPSSLKRAMLEVIVSGAAIDENEAIQYASCTLLEAQFRQNNNGSKSTETLRKCLKFLTENEFVKEVATNDSEGNTYTSTPLGRAVLASSLSPDEGLIVYQELERARRCFVLENDLHVVYQVTPLNLNETWANMDWLYYSRLWEQLSIDKKRVAECIGVEERSIILAMRNQGLTPQRKIRLLRFYSALALYDLVNEEPLSKVAAKYNCNRGMLQSLQQSAATFAGMVTAFCHHLGWSMMELVLANFQNRLHFGVQPELCDLVRISFLNAHLARGLYNAGMKTIVGIATATETQLMNVFSKLTPFESNKQRDIETVLEAQRRIRSRAIWFQGLEPMSELEAAKLLISEARKLTVENFGNELVNFNWNPQLNIQPTSALFAELKSETVNLVSCITSSTSEPILTQQPDFNMNHKTDHTKSIDNEVVALEVNSSNIESFSSCPLNNIEESSLNLSNLELPKTDHNKSIDNEVVAPEVNSSNIETFSSYPLNNIEESSLNLSDLELSQVISKEKFEVPSSVSSLSLSIKEEEDNFDISQRLLYLSSDSEDDDENKDFQDETKIKDEIQEVPNDSTNDSVSLFPDMQSDSKSAIARDICSESLLQKFFDDSSEFSIMELKPNKPTNIEVIVLDDDEMESQELFQSQSPLAASSPYVSNNGTKIVHQLDEEICNIKRQKCETFVMSDLIKKCEKAICDCEIEIIDVKNLVTFVDEWSRQACYSIAYACENAEVIQEGKIGSTIVFSNGVVPSTSKNQEAYFKANLLGSQVNVVGLAISWNLHLIYYIDLKSFEFNSLKKLLSKGFTSYNTVLIMGYGLKEQLRLMWSLFNCFPNCNTRFFDSKVASWLLNQDVIYNFGQIIELVLPFKLPLIREFLQSKLNVGLGLNVCRHNAKLRAAREVDLVHILAYEFHLKLLETNLLKCFEDIEMLLLLPLTRLETVGFGLNTEELQHIYSNLKDKMKCLENIAYKVVGHEFNLGSPAEVSKVLYTELKLGILNDDGEQESKPLKARESLLKGTSASLRKQLKKRFRIPTMKTNKEALNKLTDKHILPSIILTWRKMQSAITKNVIPVLKLKTFEPLTNMFRVCSYCENLTATGRITLSEPDIQIIPRDFNIELPGENDVIFNLRNVFMPYKGGVLVGADFSQLELRILAELSQDSSLKSALNEGFDVFKSIAAQWKCSSLAEVSDSDRQNAKQICYGMIYGMGAKSLGEQLEIDSDEAEVFMEEFKSRYPGVKTFINSSVEECRRLGYIKTLFGRRRYLKDITSKAHNVRLHGERQAVNSTIQGSAADVFKKALISVESHLDLKFPNRFNCNGPRLVHQLHDELIYECLEKDANTVADILKHNMENSTKLSVILPVKVKIGLSWGKMNYLDL